MSKEKFIITNGTLYLLSSAPLQLTDDPNLARRFSAQGGALNIIDTGPGILLDEGYEVESVVEEPDVQNAQFQIDLQKAKAELSSRAKEIEDLKQKVRARENMENLLQQQRDEWRRACNEREEVIHNQKVRIVALKRQLKQRPDEEFVPVYTLAHARLGIQKITFFKEKHKLGNEITRDKQKAAHFLSPKYARQYRDENKIGDYWKVRRVYL